MFEGLLKKVQAWFLGEAGAEVMSSEKYTITEDRAKEILADITVEKEEESEEEIAIRVQTEIGEQAEEYYEELIAAGTDGVTARIMAWDWREGKEQDYYYRYLHKGGLLSALWMAVIISIP